jgi:hypothetical protein
MENNYRVAVDEEGTLILTKMDECQSCRGIRGIGYYMGE